MMMMMMMMMMTMMMWLRLCSIKHSSYYNYFLENNSLFESVYGKNHVGKIKTYFTVIFSGHVIYLT